MKRIVVLLSIGFGLAANAGADDGILYFYGAPRLMHGESKIRMVAEQVTAKVFRDHAEVRCRFEFHNEGGATVARIGFPDGDDHAREDGNVEKPDLQNFKSRVDGKPVSLRIEHSPPSRSETPTLFQVKTVSFGKGQTHVIEDSYRAELSGGGTGTLVPKPGGGQENLYISQFTYIMSSGGSWHGDIGSAILKVQFMEKQFRKLRLVSERSFGNPVNSTKLTSLRPNVVIWAGFAKPRAEGDTVVFQRRNFKPSRKDDVTLTFNWQRFDDSISGRQ